MDQLPATEHTTTVPWWMWLVVAAFGGLCYFLGRARSWGIEDRVTVELVKANSRADKILVAYYDLQRANTVLTYNRQRQEALPVDDDPPPPVIGGLHRATDDGQPRRLVREYDIEATFKVSSEETT